MGSVSHLLSFLPMAVSDWVHRHPLLVIVMRAVRDVDFGEIYVNYLDGPTAGLMPYAGR
jgi:hypothetical protein